MNHSQYGKFCRAAGLLLLAGMVLLGATMREASAQPMGLSTGACPGLLDPVCARKKKQLLTYTNACLAANDRAVVLARGACPQACAMIYKPVCGADAQGVRRNYGNACAATADGAKIVRNGRCLPTFGRR